MSRKILFVLIFCVAGQAPTSNVPASLSKNSLQSMRASYVKVFIHLKMYISIRVLWKSHQVPNCVCKSLNAFKNLAHPILLKHNTFMIIFVFYKMRNENKRRKQNPAYPNQLCK